MSQKARTSIYYVSQIMIIVMAIATGSPARADDSSALITPEPISSPTALSSHESFHNSQ